ncbi:MAG: ATP-dependent Clp protease adaptor ClpS [Bryobacteraceae bacterium]
MTSLPITATTATPSTARPSTTPETGSSEHNDLTPLFNVVLLDDDDHTYEYVIEMLASTFFISPQRAFQHAVEVDSTGRTIVLTCDRDAAEFGRDQIHAYGADPRMERSKGSMSAIVERAS